MAPQTVRQRVEDVAHLDDYRHPQGHSRTTPSSIDESLEDLINQRFEQQEMLIRNVLSSVENQQSRIVYSNTIIPDVKSEPATVSKVGVPFYMLLKKGGQALALLSGLSLSTWLTLNVPILNPFVSILCLVASPFLYWMGHTAEKHIVN